MPRYDLLGTTAGRESNARRGALAVWYQVAREGTGHWNVSRQAQPIGGRRVHVVRTRTRPDDDARYGCCCGATRPSAGIHSHSHHHVLFRCAWRRAPQCRSAWRAICPGRPTHSCTTSSARVSRLQARLPDTSSRQRRRPLSSSALRIPEHLPSTRCPRLRVAAVPPALHPSQMRLS